MDSVLQLRKPVQILKIRRADGYGPSLTLSQWEDLKLHKHRREKYRRKDYANALPTYPATTEETTENGLKNFGEKNKKEQA